MPANLIAVNLGSYGRYRENAPAHLQSIGIRHVEIGVECNFADSVAGDLNAIPARACRSSVNALAPSP